MCVRDLTRGKCQGSRRTSYRSKLDQSDRLSSSSSSKSSSSRRARRKKKRREEVDLLCTELLSQRYPTDISNLKLEYEPLSPLMADIPSTLCPAMDPSVYSLLLSPESEDCSYLQQRPWSDTQQEFPSTFVCGEETLEDMAAGGPQFASDGHNWNECGLIEGVGWPEFSPDQRFSLQFDKPKGWQIVESEIDLPLGNSLQSNYLPCEKWPIPAPGPPCHDDDDKEGRSMNRIANSQLRSKTTVPFSVSSASSSSVLSARDHEKSSLSDHEKIGSPCRAEFQEAMAFLLERESATNYQLSAAYIEKLTRSSGQKLDIDGLCGLRRNVVNWIVKVVELLQLSPLTAAHAVSLFDRSLSQRLALDAQDEELDELLLAATACVWIAAKLEDSCSPHLSCIRALDTVKYDDDRIRKMEVLVLSSLGWRMLGVTAADFLAHMMAQLPALGLPIDLLTPLGSRSEEIMRVLLPEVEYLAYQPSVVSFSVMQCLLDECVPPVHTASFMAAFHLALPVHVESKKDFYRMLMNLVVDATKGSSQQSPNQSCSNLEKYSYLLSDLSNPDALQKQNARLLISAF